ncbi:hypothetical protein Tco_0916170 [Tanacetum coccineum]
MKEIFEELEAEVDQNAVYRKHDEIEQKNLLIAHDNLIVECLSKDVFYVAMNSELNVSRFTEMNDAHTVVQARCLELEAELSKLRDKVQNDDHNELVKRFSNLEVNHLNLQLKYQNLKERFRNNTSPSTRDAPDFELVFAHEKIKASTQGKNNAIKELRMQLSQNRILPAKSVNKQKVEAHPRIIKSSLKTTNRVDSSISSKRTVINSNSHSVCKTCNKCLISANHDMCVVTYLHSVNVSPSVKNVVRKVKQVWKPKHVRQVWKATGKVLTNVGYQWRPTGRIFTLGEQCPLNRITKPKVVLVRQWKPTGRIIPLGEQCPITRSIASTSAPIVVETQAPMVPIAPDNACSNQLDLNSNWGSGTANSPFLSVFKCTLGLALQRQMAFEHCSSSLGPQCQQNGSCATQFRTRSYISDAWTDKFRARIKSGSCRSLCTPINKDLEILFQPMFDEYLEPPLVERPISPVPVVPAPVTLAGTPSSTTIDQDAPSPSISPSSSALQSPSLQQGVAAEPTIIEANPFAPIDNNPFVNVFAPEHSFEASSSGDVSSTESPYVTQTHEHLRKWIASHPIENIIGNPS